MNILFKPPNKYLSAVFVDKSPFIFDLNIILDFLTCQLFNKISYP